MATGRFATLSNGVKIPLVGLGTWQAEPGQVKEAVKVALQNGYQHIDAAAIYGNEQEVGQGMAESGVPREKYFLTSKLWCNSHRPERVEPALDATLKDLGTDYLDLYLIHWPSAFKPGDDLMPKDASGSVILDTDVKLIDTWRAMVKLLDTGKVKAVGVSNFTKENLESITADGLPWPHVQQIEVHPYLAQEDYIRYQESKGIHVTAYSPFANLNPLYQKPGEPRLVDHELIREMCEKYNATPSQVLTSWAASRGTSVVPKTVTPSRVVENFKDFVMEKEDIAKITGLDRAHRYNESIAGSPYKYFT